MPGVSTMSDQFHEWLSEWPCMYYKKYGEDVYTFIEETE